MATKSDIKNVVVYDGLTGVITEREANQEELDLFIANAQENEALKSASDARALARQSALAKLADLGLTAEEIAAL